LTIVYSFIAIYTIYSKFSLDLESVDSLAGLLVTSFFNCFGIECGIRSGDGICEPTSRGEETPALERA